MAEYPSVCLRPVVLNPCEKNATRSLRNFNFKNCFLPYTILFYLSIIRSCDSQISFNFPKGQLFVSLSFNFHPRSNSNDSSQLSDQFDSPTRFSQREGDKRRTTDQSIYYNPGPRRHSDQIRDFTATETRRERPIHHPSLSI